MDIAYFYFLRFNSCQAFNNIIFSAPGFSFCWDNIQKQVTARHATSENTGKFLIWAMSYAVENRVPAKPVFVTHPMLAQDIPLTDLLPSPDDFALLRARLVVIIKRVLVECVPFFSGLDVVEHIPHEFTDEMGQTSQVVCRGQRIRTFLL